MQGDLSELNVAGTTKYNPLEATYLDQSVTFDKGLGGNAGDAAYRKVQTGLKDSSNYVDSGNIFSDTMIDAEMEAERLAAQMEANTMAELGMEWLG